MGYHAHFTDGGMEAEEVHILPRVTRLMLVAQLCLGCSLGKVEQFRSHFILVDPHGVQPCAEDLNTSGQTDRLHNSGELVSHGWFPICLFSSFFSSLSPPAFVLSTLHVGEGSGPLLSGFLFTSDLSPTFVLSSKLGGLWIYPRVAKARGRSLELAPAPGTLPGNAAPTGGFICILELGSSRGGVP